VTYILVGVWNGGANYAPGGIPSDYAEEFDSVGHAMTAMIDRRDSGHFIGQEFRYIFQPRVYTHTPCAHSDNTGYLDLFLFERYVTPEEIRARIDSGEIWRRLEFGPRGGIVQHHG
jgi:hypothetical protein